MYIYMRVYMQKFALSPFLSLSFSHTHTHAYIQKKPVTSLLKTVDQIEETNHEVARWLENMNLQV